MDSVDPSHREYQKIIDNLRQGGHYSGEPPLRPPTDSGRSEPVKADWEPRVTRLEYGFVAGFILTFGAIISSYLMLADKIDDLGDRSSNTTVAVSDARGDIKVLSERTVNMDKKLDAISAKLDRK
jgi:hypothetical protein